MSYNTFISPKCYSVSIAPGEVYGQNIINIEGTATYCEIVNYGTGPVNVRLNGDTAATFVLVGESSQVFPPNSAYITSIDFAAAASGMTTCTIDVFVGVVNN